MAILSRLLADHADLRSRLTRMRVMTPAQLAGTLAGGVNQQRNQA